MSFLYAKQNKLSLLVGVLALASQIYFTQAQKIKNVISKPSQVIQMLDEGFSISENQYQPGLVIPLYLWPDFDGKKCIQKFYLDIANSPMADRTIVIMNPSNGPQWSNDSWKLKSYKACIQLLRENKVKVVGYVHSKVGYPQISEYRQSDEVKRDIDQWENDYGVIDGIFIDEVSNLWPDTSFDTQTKTLSYYDDIIENITKRNANWIVVMNPGAPYLAELVQRRSRVLSVLFEDLASNWNPLTNCGAIQRDNFDGKYGQFEKGPWCKFVPFYDNIEQGLKTYIDRGLISQAQNIALIYSVPDNRQAVENLIQQGLKNKVGWFFLTNNDFSTSWTNEPSATLWQYLLSALSNKKME
eukprot:403374332